MSNMHKWFRGPFTEPESEDDAYERRRQEMDDNSDELEICRISAEALEYGITKENYSPRGGLLVWKDGKAIDWNPLTNAEQRWECVEWLLAHGHDVNITCSLDEAQHTTQTRKFDWTSFSCPASEFPARAVAELQRRSKA